MLRETESTLNDAAKSSITQPAVSRTYQKVPNRTKSTYSL